MTVLIMTKGLPGSGKSTWAEKYVLDRKAGTVVRVNKDLLRKMLHAGRFAKEATESQVRTARDGLIATFLSQGVDVISDDTNFEPEHEKTFRALAEQYAAEFEVKDFTDVSLETCIKRDLKRLDSVGEAVIRRMHNRWLLPQVIDPPEYDLNLRDAVIVDIDGTVAKMVQRGPYDTSLYHTDVANKPIVRLVNDLYNSGEQIVFCSGRDSDHQEVTRQWLIEHVGNWTLSSPLYMRPAGDTRKDAIVKRELYEAHIKGNWNVRFVLDDRNQVVEMWRGLGLTCLQVADGHF